MNKLSIWHFTILCLLLLVTQCVIADDPQFNSKVQQLLQYMKPTDKSAGCINFTPYVNGYNPDEGPHPPPELIDQLLDVIVTETSFTCIKTYGVLNGLNYTFEAARKRNLKVMAVLWIDMDDNINEQSIQVGIESSFQYKDTIIALVCGNELRVRVGKGASEPHINNCIDKLRAANVEQPLSVIESWWGWVDEQAQYRQWSVIDRLDWVGINVFPWWESMFDRGCYTEEGAVDFHIETIHTVQKLYPDKPVILTEFGWPAGPNDFVQANPKNLTCGTATEAHQTYVISQTIRRLQQESLYGIMFSSFREHWKHGREGVIASYWGICGNESPFQCKNVHDVKGQCTQPDTCSLGPNPIVSRSPIVDSSRSDSPQTTPSTTTAISPSNTRNQPGAVLSSSASITQTILSSILLLIASFLVL